MKKTLNKKLVFALMALLLVAVAVLGVACKPQEPDNDPQSNPLIAAAQERLSNFDSTGNFYVTEYMKTQGVLDDGSWGTVEMNVAIVLYGNKTRVELEVTSIDDDFHTTYTSAVVWIDGDAGVVYYDVSDDGVRETGQYTADDEQPTNVSNAINAAQELKTTMQSLLQQFSMYLQLNSMPIKIDGTTLQIDIPAMGMGEIVLYIDIKDDGTFTCKEEYSMNFDYDGVQGSTEMVVEFGTNSQDITMPDFE